MKILAVILGAFCFLSFAWATLGHFIDRTNRRSVPLAVLMATSVAAFGLTCWGLLGDEPEGDPTVGLVWHHARVVSISLGILAYIGSLGLFWWAVISTRRRRLSIAFSPDPPNFLIAEGPYAWVRHPFYTAYILCWIGNALVTLWASIAVLGVALVLQHYWAARREENKFAASAHATAYADYKSEVAMFLPGVF